MHPDDPLGRENAQLPGDRRAPVPALSAVPLIPQSSHQLIPAPRDALNIPAPLTRRPGEPEPRNRRNNQVKRITRIPAVRPGVGQRPDDLHELHDRAGPAVRHDQRQRPRCCRTHVQEVHGLPVDLRGELRERVQPVLKDPPVVGRAPVLGQFPHVVQRDAVVPADIGQLVRPPGPGQPVPQVIQLRLRNVDPEFIDGIHAHRPYSGTAARTAARRPFSFVPNGAWFPQPEHLEQSLVTPEATGAARSGAAH